MGRFRLGTLMLLVVIVALATALAVQQRRASRREAAMQAEIASLRAASGQLPKAVIMAENQVMVAQAKEALARAEFFGSEGNAKLHRPPMDGK